MFVCLHPATFSLFTLRERCANSQFSDIWPFRTSCDIVSQQLHIIIPQKKKFLKSADNRNVVILLFNRLATNKKRTTLAMYNHDQWLLKLNGCWLSSVWFWCYVFWSLRSGTHFAFLVAFFWRLRKADERNAPFCSVCKQAYRKSFQVYYVSLFGGYNALFKASNLYLTWVRVWNSFLYPFHSKYGLYQVRRWYTSIRSDNLLTMFYAIIKR